MVQAGRTLLPPAEDAPLQLIAQAGRSYTFQNYRELKKSKTWQTEVFEASLNEVKTLMAPHWEVRYRLELECLIPNTHQLLTAKNPQSAHDWWRKQGQAVTERFLERQAAGSDRQDSSSQLAEIVQDIASVEPIGSISCLTCSWNDPNYYELQPHELWCGYYRDTVGRDKADVMPDQCRKWHSTDIDAYSFQHMPQLGNGKVSSQAIEKTEKVVTIAAQTSEVGEAGISDREFATMLGNVLKLTYGQLWQLEEAIQSCKQEVSEDS